MKVKIFKLDHTKWGWGRKYGARINDFYITKIFGRRNALPTKICRQNVLSTKCLSTKVSFDERNRIRTNQSIKSRVIGEIIKIVREWIKSFPFKHQKRWTIIFVLIDRYTNEINRNEFMWVISQLVRNNNLKNILIIRWIWKCRSLILEHY